MDWGEFSDDGFSADASRKAVYAQGTRLWNSPIGERLCRVIQDIGIFKQKKNNREAHSQHREISIANYCTEEKYIYNFETLM